MSRKIFLIAGAAAVALAAPATAERGGDRDSRPQASKSDERKAARSQRAERRQDRADRPQRVERHQRPDRPRLQRAERPQRVDQNLQRADRPQRFDRQRVEKAERSIKIDRQRFQRTDRSTRSERQRVLRAERPARVERQRIERAERRLDRQVLRQAERRVERKRLQQAERRFEKQRENRAERRAPYRIERRVADVRDATTMNRRIALRDERRDSLPKEFRKRGDMFVERPMRKMKFKKDRHFVAVGDRIDPTRYSRFVPTTYRSRYYDTRDHYYRYDDDRGYLYRIDRDDNFVRAMIPLFGGYGIGDPWPQTYYSSYVPMGYRTRYYDTPDYHYRYDGRGIYRIDAQTQLITALVALLMGQGFGVGQVLPASYGAYNIPLAYRSTYYDRDDAWYRYGDGYIYEVDPRSYRIGARYPIYGGEYDYLVGEPWPAAYPGYNVPIGYQSLYYDTPQHHYRYANGAIYQVDPTTQMILALAALVSGQQFAVGQQLPAGYSTYNVPFAYRDRYYDNDDAWYRYADGFVYEVDPRTGLIQDSFLV